MTRGNQAGSLLEAMTSTTLTAGDLLRARADDDRIGLVFGERTWTWSEYVQECGRRAALFQQLQAEAGRPLHVGVLLENTPEFAFLLGAGALSGAVIVGLNGTRRGDALVRDLQITDCDLLVSDEVGFAALNGAVPPLPEGNVWDCGAPDYEERLPAAGSVEPSAVTSSSLFMLIFTSGTSGDPKAVRVTHRKIVGPATTYAQAGAITRDDVSLLTMPMFHSACVSIGWGASVAAGATMVVRRRFSASQFLTDVRTHGITYFHYVGKALSYILATAEQADDHLNPLRIAKGNEASEADIEAFGRRFGCQVSDGFGSTEGGVVVLRTPDTPPGALGRGAEGVEVRHGDTGTPAAVAEFDDEGRLLNADEAIGELVNVRGAGAFEGYYNDPVADAARLRDGCYWSGDLAYRDDAGFIYFAGRTEEWLRVQGENLAAAPIERVLDRLARFREVVVYAVPDADAGDEVMAAVLLRPDAAFDPAEFTEFLGEQLDLSPKAWPRYVRIATELPRTASNKVLKRELRAEGWWAGDDPIWCRPERQTSYREMTPDDKEALGDRPPRQIVRVPTSPKPEKENRP